MNKFLTGTVALMAAAFLFAACNDKQKKANDVPVVYVDAYINTTLPQYQDLNVIGGYAYFPGGNRGLFVYHNSNDEVVAFDRNCTYRPLDSCSTVTLDNSLAYLRCGGYNGSTWTGCCNTKYTLDGFPYGGPAQYALRQYYVTRNGAVLRVTSFPQ